MSPLLQLMYRALAPTPQEVRKVVREACGTPEAYSALVKLYREAVDGLVAKTGLSRAGAWAALKMRTARDRDDVTLACLTAAELEEQEAEQKPA